MTVVAFHINPVAGDAVALLDRIERIGAALYGFDCAHAKGDTLPPDEWSIRDFKAAPFAEAHPMVRQLYHARARVVIELEADPFS